MNHYRSHNCSELRASNVGEIVKISGWVHRKRDHGGLLFIDVRDHFGITQCVTDMESEVFKLVEPLKVCLLYTSPSPRDLYRSRMPSSA